MFVLNVDIAISLCLTLEHAIQYIIPCILVGIKLYYTNHLYLVLIVEILRFELNESALCCNKKLYS